MKPPYFRPLNCPAKVPTQPYHQLAKRPSSEIFQLMQEKGIHAMISEFYHALHQSSIKEMFQKRPIEESIARSSAFFIQLMGGEQIYRQRYGEPKLRARHLPFRITEEARKVWLATFYDVLDHPQTFSFPPHHLKEFKTYLDTFSKWMVNS
ncbi:MAG: hypothetical protein OXC44_00820 [Proteobacteria bacterium]|nr:hypothetical protein [Pseudomonadota bacterium]